MVEDVASENAPVGRRGVRESGKFTTHVDRTGVVASQLDDDSHHHETANTTDALENQGFMCW